MVIAALGFFCFLPAALADQVTPNERVTTRLRVRAEASSDAEVVGYLNPGEKAELVKTIGAWREVKATTWAGFVPSGYTSVISDKPAAAPTTATAQPKPAAQPKPQADKGKTCGDGKALKVHFYDVGQALSALVTFPDDKHWLVDAGTGAAGASTKFRKALAADLAGKPIDVMWITHQHADHMNSAKYILDKLKVTAYVDNGNSSAARALAKTKGILHGPTDDLPVPATPVKITPFLPSSPVKSCKSNENNCSIGLRIEYCSSSILFIGDAEKDEEALLPQDQTATLLQVGHHGSPTSSSPPFIKAVKPQYAVISVGKPRTGTNAGYCHPNAATIETLNSVLPEGGTKPLEAFKLTDCKHKGASKKNWTKAAANERIWATERDGDVTLETTGDGNFHRLGAPPE
jgi:competence protein ComEC